MAPPKVEKGFSPSKLQQMVEPLTVRVEKVVGGLGSAVELPPTSGGNTDGTGWTKEDVLKLEAHIDQHHGPGVYEGKIADANNTTMQWSFGKRPGPAYQPPIIQPQFGGVAPQATPIGAQGGNVLWAAPAVPSVQHGWPQGQQQPVWNGTQWVSPPPVFQQPPAPWQWQQPPQQVWPPASGAPSAGESALAQMQAQLEAERRARLESEAKAERERAEARHAAEIAAVREELAKMREAAQARAAAPPPPPAEDPRVKALEEQNRQNAARQDRLEADARMEKMLASLQQQNQAQMQAMQQQLAALAQNNNQSALIPLMSLIQTVTAQSTEAAKEMARSVTAAQDKTIGFLQANQNQSASVLQNMNGAFDTYNKVMHSAFEMVQNAQGGPSSVGDKILDGLQFLGAQGKGIADKFFAAREKKVQADLKAKEIDANVEIAKRQMEVQAQVYVAQGGAPQQQAQQQPQGAQVAGQAPQQQAQQPQGATLGQSAPVQQVAASETPAAPPVLRAVPSSADKRDKEMFVYDQLIDQVGRLRLGVRGAPGKPKLSPEEAAIAVMQALVKIKQLGLDIPVMKLYEEGDFYELFAVILPSTTASFHEEAATALANLLSRGAQLAQQQGPPPQAAADEGDEEDEDEDEEDDDGEDDDAPGDQAS